MNHAHDIIFNFSSFFLTFFIFITLSCFSFTLKDANYSNDINISNINNIAAKRHNDNMAKENISKHHFKESIHLR